VLHPRITFLTVGNSAHHKQGENMKRIPKPEHGSVEWRNLRHRDTNGNCIFGASEAGALMGASEFTTRAELFASKMSEPVITPPTAAMLKGIYFESGLGRFAASELGMNLHEPTEMFARGRWVATLDFASDDYATVVECKVTNAKVIRDESDLMPAWVLQGHVQHYCTGAQIYFSVFDRQQQLSLIPMPIQPGVIDQLNEMAELLGSAVDEQTIPGWLEDEMTADLIQQLVPVEEGKGIEADEHLVNWITDLETSKKMKKDAEEAEQYARDQIAKRMGDAEFVVADGRTILSWKRQKGRARFDLEAFKTAHPDLAKQFMTEGAPIRVMRFGKGK
jgi:hypothetical protein